MQGPTSNGAERKATVTETPRPELPKLYDPKAVESRHYGRWKAAGLFHDDPDPARPPFIICMPPPNVTARAHLGHGSTYTPMDVLVRYRRMLGDNANWMPGTDHAAIATEAVLVRQLASEGRSRESLGREAYLELAWKWSRETGGTIFKQFEALGYGPDWERSRFTMDDTLSRAVNRAFVQLYRDGLIYRGKRLVNWDPASQSTISDAEIEHEERDGYLWRVRYPFVGENAGGIEIATTRPETILADTAIAVHPLDERYRALVGKRVLVPPMFARSIPIIADAAVDADFGTGAVKVTPAHDATDYDIGLRHGLEMPSVLDLHARISSDEVDVGRYDGMDRFEARTAIVDDLRAGGNLVEEQPYRHAVALSERSHDVIEPLLSLQWFVTMKPLAEPALAAYRNGTLRFVPARYGRTYEQWLENIRDWNISRQVWWGHQLPVWYTSNGEVVVAESEEEARKISLDRFGHANLARDMDTLDTWFSSGLWPFSILGWPENTPELAHWYPSSVLVTGWEIIFLWVARMVMLGLKFMGEVPFPTVFVAPLVFDARGRKMSKSLGNAIDPVELIEKYGADAFRMGMLRQMRLEGQEVRFNESRCEEARNFNNKIWNATRYACTLPEGLPPAMTLPPGGELSLADRWILTRLHDTAASMTQSFDAFDFGSASETIWKFVWYEACDWYLESTKTAANARSRAAVLSFVLNHAMRLLHPIEPFITEETWLLLPHDGDTIMTASWPDLAEIPVDRQAEADYARVRETVERVRNERAHHGIADRVRAPIEIPQGSNQDAADLILHLAWGNAVSVAGAGDFFSSVRLKVDREAHRRRLEQDRARIAAEVKRGVEKLANEKFVSNAKPDVVAKERAKLEAYRAELASIEAELQ